MANIVLNPQDFPAFTAITVMWMIWSGMTAGINRNKAFALARNETCRKADVQ